MLTYGPHLVVLFREIEETFGGGTNRRKWGLEGVLLKVIPDPGVPCSGHPGCSELSSTTLPHNPHPKKKKVETYDILGKMSISSHELWVLLPRRRCSRSHKLLEMISGRDSEALGEVG